MSAQWRTSLDVYTWFRAIWWQLNSANTVPHCFRGKISKEAAAKSRPNSGTGQTARGASCSKLTCGCVALGGPFLVESLLSKLWTCAKRGCMMPGHEEQLRSWGGALRLCGAGIWKTGKRRPLLSNECHWHLQTAHNIICYFVFDIVVHDLQYQMSDWTSILGTICLTRLTISKLLLLISESKRNIILDRGDLQYWPSTSKFTTFDIGKLRYRSYFDLLCRNQEHDISKLSSYNFAIIPIILEK